jgi:hypothetical protein
LIEKNTWPPIPDQIAWPPGSIPVTLKKTVVCRGYPSKQRWQARELPSPEPWCGQYIRSRYNKRIQSGQ